MTEVDRTTEDRIAAILDLHDIDDYCDDLPGGDQELGVFCLHCGWKGKTQREVNRHLASVVARAAVEAMNLTEERREADWYHDYVRDKKVETRLVTPWAAVVVSPQPATTTADEPCDDCGRGETCMCGEPRHDL